MKLDKYQFKQLKYLANKHRGPGQCGPSDSEEMKSRTYRDFCFQEYSKDGAKHITNIYIDGHLFTGTYEDLVDAVANGYIEFIDERNPDIVPVPLDPQSQMDAIGKHAEEILGVDQGRGKDQAAVTVVEKPAKESPRELLLKCALRHLNRECGEIADLDMDSLVQRHPDAIVRYTALLQRDNISLYNVTPEAIKSAFPREYDELTK